MLSCLADLESKTDFLRHELTRSVFCFLWFCLFFPSVGFKAGILKECESSLPSRGLPLSIYREASSNETHWRKHYCVCFPNLCTHVYTHINHCQQSFFCIKPIFLSLRYLPFFFLLLGLSTSLMGTHDLLSPYYGPALYLWLPYIISLILLNDPVKKVFLSSQIKDKND